MRYGYKVDQQPKEVPKLLEQLRSPVWKDILSLDDFKDSVVYKAAFVEFVGTLAKLKAVRPVRNSKHNARSALVLSPNRSFC